jgi:hypothetical protein
MDCVLSLRRICPRLRWATTVISEDGKMRFELAAGWHLLRVEVNGLPEWIICDPEGDRLGGTEKHKAEFDQALLTGMSALDEIANNPCSDPEGNSQIARRVPGQG